MKLFLFAMIVFSSLSGFAQSLEAGAISLADGTDAKDQPLYVLRIQGAIAWPMADKLEQILAPLKPKQPLLIILNSNGGAANEGLKLIALLTAEKRNGRKILTSVENGTTCASMCVMLYAQGENRYAGEASMFMFHGATRHEMTNVPNELKTREMLQILIDAGVSKKWIDQLWALKVFTLPGSYWMSGRELVDAGSNLVTRAISRHEIEEPWYAPFDPTMGPK
ncbi:MAG: ATP-dependent Clp protease proteolytic subunit [Bdellovibrio sp.]|jgi:ATP-dependent protease ClpP protease subunit